LEKYSVPKVSKKWEKVGERVVSTKHVVRLIILMEPLLIMENHGLYGYGGYDNPKWLIKSLILIDTLYGLGDGEE